MVVGRRDVFLCCYRRNSGRFLLTSRDNVEKSVRRRRARARTGDLAWGRSVNSRWGSLPEEIFAVLPTTSGRGPNRTRLSHNAAFVPKVRERVPVHNARFDRWSRRLGQPGHDPDGADTISAPDAAQTEQRSRCGQPDRVAPGSPERIPESDGKHLVHEIEHRLETPGGSPSGGGSRNNGGGSPGPPPRWSTASRRPARASPAPAGPRPGRGGSFRSGTSGCWNPRKLFGSHSKLRPASISASI